MSGQQVRVDCFTVSADGFGAGLNQSLDRPMGIGAGGLHQWFFPTQTCRRNFGQEGGETGVDEDFALRGMSGIGAWILGRNMFGPVRGDWPNEDWQGWWGEEPPYHCPVIVLTHYARPPFEMKGGTVFHFETGGIDVALERARAFAGDKDIRIGGGAQTVREYLKAGLIDRMHLAVSPVLLGSGEPLFQGLDLPQMGYKVSEGVQGERALHLIVERG